MSEAIATDIRVRYVILMRLTALPAWLALDRTERRSLVAREVAPVLADHRRVSVRWIDVEAFTAECSDLLLAETDDIMSWNRLFEALRDTVVFSRPLFRLEQLTVGVEDGYLAYEQAHRKESDNAA